METNKNTTPRVHGQGRRREQRKVLDLYLIYEEYVFMGRGGWEWLDSEGVI